jgi:hypothetical protein
MGNVRPLTSYSKLQANTAQGAKAASKRDRKDKDAKPAKSQLKVNEQAKDIQCDICKSTFLKTTRGPAYVFPDLSCALATPRDSLDTALTD